MRVLLIYPLPRHERVPGPTWLPLGLSYLAAVLQAEGHTVSIFDRFSSQAVVSLDKEKINAAMLERIKSFQPDLIGFNTVSPLIYDTVECVDLIRQDFNGLVVAGGHHATALPALTLEKIAGLDGLIVGEGEKALARLAGGENPAVIPGVWWRNGGGSFAHTCAEQLFDLDSLPFPSLDLLDMSFYSRLGRQAIRSHYLTCVSLLTSRGCVKKCEFCSESLTYGKGVRFHSVAYVIEWLERVLAQYRVESIYFHDNDFLIDEGRVREFCERMLAAGKNRKIKWGIQARAERINSDILKLLRRAGCVLLELGIESALQEQLDAVNKGSSVAINEKAIDLCRREGIAVHANFITGFAGETIADMEKKLDWVKKTKPNTFVWYPLQIHPGTVLYQKTGMNFFEQNEWTEESIHSYYSEDPLSAVSKEERKEWMKQHYAPFAIKRNRINILRVNPPSRLMGRLAHKAGAHLARKSKHRSPEEVQK